MTQSPNSNVFPDIGLALSGGGYRAAGFHLGLLAYLNRINLLSQVKMLSTISGGTFTGAKYVLSLVEGKTFPDFYEEYHKFLKETNLVKLALNKLGEKEDSIASNKSHRLDLITAAAQVYAETFLAKSNNEPYRLGDIFNADISLEEVAFNSTEFRHGIAFRFQHSLNTRSLIGNGKISIPKDKAKDIRIADIVATSSCFPGGFEPLNFPEDFNWSNEQVLEDIRDIVYKNEQQAIALMDGGIYDNQGIESLHLANQRNDYKLSLLIMSDVDKKNDSLYDFPELLNISNISLHQVDWLSKILTILCLSSSLIVVIEIIKNIIIKHQFIWLDIFLYAVILLLAVPTVFILYRGRKTIKQKILSKIPEVGDFAWKDLRKLTINQLANGIYLRSTSLQAMAGKAFMKRIRRLQLASMYRYYPKRRNKKQPEEKLIANFIYNLASNNSKTVDKEFLELPDINKPDPNSQLQQIIDRAAEMGTTLWFTGDNQLDELIISGEVTICYNLIRNIVRNYGKDPNSYPPNIQAIWQSLVADWNSFCSNPQILL